MFRDLGAPIGCFVVSLFESELFEDPAVNNSGYSPRRLIGRLRRTSSDAGRFLEDPLLFLTMIESPLTPLSSAWRPPIPLRGLEESLDLKGFEMGFWWIEVDVFCFFGKRTLPLLFL